MTRLVILDRDGVINKDSDDFIKSPDEFVTLPGSLEAIARLNAAGYQVAVATNQSGIARGLFDLATFNAMQQKLDALLAEKGGHIDALAYCPHAPDAGCDCRKPKPGLLQQISHELKIELAGVPVIGDSLRDLQSAQAVGATPILVRTGKGERSLEQLIEEPSLANVPVFKDLAAAVDALLAGALND
jgi:D-glycero-D-manno-heptose 1,7-bisphosphate phosphatase